MYVLAMYQSAYDKSLRKSENQRFLGTFWFWIPKAVGKAAEYCQWRKLSRWFSQLKWASCPVDYRVDWGCDREAEFRYFDHRNRWFLLFIRILLYEQCIGMIQGKKLSSWDNILYDIIPDRCLYDRFWQKGDLCNEKMVAGSTMPRFFVMLLCSDRVLWEH